MYYVTKTTHVRLDGGRGVVLGAGPRGKQTVDGEVVDFDAKVEKALPPKVLADLLKSGVIEKRADPE